MVFSNKKNINIKNMRTRSQPIRTLSLIPMRIKIGIERSIPLYQKLAPKIKELKILGMNYKEIATKLKICQKTIRKSSLMN